MLSHCSLFLKRPAGFIYFLSGRRTLCNGMQGGNATRGWGADGRGAQAPGPEAPVLDSAATVLKKEAQADPADTTIENLC